MTTPTSQIGIARPAAVAGRPVAARPMARADTRAEIARLWGARLLSLLLALVALESLFSVLMLAWLAADGRPAPGAALALAGTAAGAGRGLGAPGSDRRRGREGRPRRGARPAGRLARRGRPGRPGAAARLGGDLPGGVPLRRRRLLPARWLSRPRRALRELGRRRRVAARLPVAAGAPLPPVRPEPGGGDRGQPPALRGLAAGHRRPRPAGGGRGRGAPRDAAARRLAEPGGHRRRREQGAHRRLLPVARSPAPPAGRRTAGPETPGLAAPARRRGHAGLHGAHPAGPGPAPRGPRRLRRSRGHRGPRPLEGGPARRRAAGPAGRRHGRGAPPLGGPQLDRFRGRGRPRLDQRRQRLLPGEQPLGRTAAG
jgi:hypothetical protein